MTPATVVLVSPPCATPAAWSRVIPLLEDRGVPNIAVQLPSCLPESDLDDAAFLRSVLDECGDPVVLVGHSSGGLVLTEVGGHPSVKHLVYMDAVMWDVGESWRTLLTGGVAEGWAACVRSGARRDRVRHRRGDGVPLEPGLVSGRRSRVRVGVSATALCRHGAHAHRRRMANGAKHVHLPGRQRDEESSARTVRRTSDRRHRDARRPLSSLAATRRDRRHLRSDRSRSSSNRNRSRQPPQRKCVVSRQLSKATTGKRRDTAA